LDCDGTLASVTCNPAQAYPYSEIRDAPGRIQRKPIGGGYCHPAQVSGQERGPFSFWIGAAAHDELIEQLHSNSAHPKEVSP
jgi:hypothetical protein